MKGTAHDEYAANHELLPHPTEWTEGTAAAHDGSQPFALAAGFDIIRAANGCVVVIFG
jgi:hypothetical protein